MSVIHAMLFLLCTQRWFVEILNIVMAETGACGNESLNGMSCNLFDALF